MKDILKPLIDSTYPAIMAGLCLTSLGLNQVISFNFWLQPILALSSFLFIVSSMCIFANSVVINWGTKSNGVSEDKVTSFWKIGKWSFFLGVCLLLVAISLINFYFLSTIGQRLRIILAYFVLNSISSTTYFI